MEHKDLISKCNRMITMVKESSASDISKRNIINYINLLRDCEKDEVERISTNLYLILEKTYKIKLSSISVNYDLLKDKKFKNMNEIDKYFSYQIIDDFFMITKYKTQEDGSKKSNDKSNILNRLKKFFK